MNLINNKQVILKRNGQWLKFKLKGDGIKRSTCVKDPVNRSLCYDIFIVPNKVHLLPHIAEEAINFLLAKIGSTFKPFGAENTNWEMQDSAFFIGV
jgi:hypothetical protein